MSIAPGSPGHLVVVQDVSERHALLSELRAANRAKDDFIAMLGHELRNPLAPIRTAVDLMRLRQGATVGREVAVIERHVKHMVQLIDDLLDVTRIVKGKLELRLAPVDLFDVVRDAIEMSSPLFEQSGHRLDCDVPRGLVVSADSGRLTQIIANLLMNAAKYTPPQGHVEIVGVRSGGAIELVVRDNGPGIAEEIRAHIFDLFVQERQSLDRSRGGLGLGLAIVKSLAALHGGDVSLDSEIGRGSTFTLRLPPLATDKVKEQRAPERTAMARLAGVRVLVVDDNEDAARSLGESLRMAGAVVDLAHDGPGALRIAAVNAPAVVLADLGLPVIDGYELAERLHARLPHVPIIAISGYGDVHDVERAARAGFVAHVLKPVSLPELTALVCSLVPTRSS
ncbi:MAG: hybrid sensor histidine kinase/response regulator [Kofleriaceae bacterium]